MSLAEVVIREIKCDCSLKIIKLLAESIGQPRESSAVHPQSVILLFNVRRANAVHNRLANHDRFRHFNDIGGAIPTG